MPQPQEQKSDIGIIEITYQHVHDCRAGREKRPCQFFWGNHRTPTDESALPGVFSCDPRQDDTNLLLDGQVFIIHKGVC